jgi:hypothetical protein
MTRDDKVRALVAQRMGDSDAIREALEASIKGSFKEGDASHILIDIASAIESGSQPGVSQAHWEGIATRLLHSLERYARAALTAEAEDETPEDDENDE